MITSSNNDITIKAEGGKQRDLLTNGNITDTELLFANGDVIWVEV